MNKKIALVTGANRGIGLEVCRQLAKQGIKVILSSRDENKGKEACKTLQKENLDIIFHQLDVTDKKSIENIHDFIKKEFGRLDILINNAGISIEGDKRIDEIDCNALDKTLETNLYGPFLLCQKFVPLMKKNNYGRIVNVSTGMAQLKYFVDLGYSYTRAPIYRISKTALNALTCFLSYELKGFNILINSASPGFVRTDMTGPEAPLSVEEGADTIVWLATPPDNSPSGKFFQERRIIEW